MVDGDLRCLGTQQHLKNVLGGGYKLTIRSENDMWEKIENFISNNITNDFHIIRSNDKNKIYGLNSEIDV